MYVRPRTIDEAVAALAAPGALALCGGTDVFPAHVGRVVQRPVVDLSAVAGLRGITEDEGVIRIGAATTWTEIAGARLPPAFDALKQAAREVGSIQIQNRGSVAGNLCNASPAADGVPPLLALDAMVEVVSPSGRRVLRLSEFITGYRQTALAPGELVSAILVPEPSPLARSAFVKLGARRYLVISILMAAVVLVLDEDARIAQAAIAVGAASPVARRLTALEGDLVGVAVEGSLADRVRPDHLSPLSPIGDVRASREYRLEAALAVVGEALDRATAGVALRV